MKLPKQKKTSGNPSLQKCSKNFNSFTILLMEEILHQFAGSLSHYLQGFLHPGWCRISSIWHIVGLEEACSATQLHWVQQSWRSDKRPRGTAAPLIVRWLHLHVIKKFDQILQCILIVEGIESETIHQSSIFGVHLPGTSKSLVKLGEKSLAKPRWLPPRRTAPRAAASSPAARDVENPKPKPSLLQLLPCELWVQHLWLNKSAVDFIPKKNLPPIHGGFFSFVESSRRCEKKTWELRYLGREESSWWWISVLFVLMKLLRFFLASEMWFL